MGSRSSTPPRKRSKRRLGCKRNPPLTVIRYGSEGWKKRQCTGSELEGRSRVSNEGEREGGVTNSPEARSHRSSLSSVSPTQASSPTPTMSLTDPNLSRNPNFTTHPHPQPLSVGVGRSCSSLRARNKRRAVKEGYGLGRLMGAGEEG